MDGAFFAGVIAGEGSFQITPNNAGQTWQCGFALTMRADDTDLVRDLRDFAGCGALYPRSPQGRAKPQTVWTVTRIEDCQRLAATLDGLPLMNKKCGDFRIWREAVAHWTNDALSQQRRFSNLAQLNRELRVHRAFELQPNYLPVDIAPSYVDGFLGGFATAEAHFGATLPGGHPRLVINLRLDDRAVLDFLRDHYGLGHVKVVERQTRGRSVASWRITALDDTTELVSILERGRPRGRQGNVFREWSALVRYVTDCRHRRQRRHDHLRFKRELVWRIRVQRAYKRPDPLERPDRTAERRQRCLAALREWDKRSPIAYAATCYTEHRRQTGGEWPHRNTVARAFGSWPAALEAAGLPTTDSRDGQAIRASVETSAASRVSRRERQRDTIVATVRTCRQALGRWPRAREFLAWRLEYAPTSPSQMTIYRAFPGGWTEVLATAQDAPYGRLVLTRSAAGSA